LPTLYTVTEEITGHCGQHTKRLRTEQTYTETHALFLEDA